MKEQNIRAIFASLTGVKKEDVSIQKLVTTLTKGMSYVFTDQEIHLRSEVRTCFGLDQEVEEAQLCLTSNNHSIILQGSKIICVKPTTGNSAPAWASLHDLEVELAKIEKATIVRVYRTTFRNGKKIGEGRNHVKTLYYKHLRHDNDSFQDETCHGRYFFYEFKVDGNFVADPRGFSHNPPTQPEIVQMIADGVGPRHIPDKGKTGLRTAFEIALSRVPHT